MSVFPIARARNTVRSGGTSARASLNTDTGEGAIGAAISGLGASISSFTAKRAAEKEKIEREAAVIQERHDRATLAAQQAQYVNANNKFDAEIAENLAKAKDPADVARIQKEAENSKRTMMGLLDKASTSRMPEVKQQEWDTWVLGQHEAQIQKTVGAVRRQGLEMTRAMGEKEIRTLLDDGEWEVARQTTRNMAPIFSASKHAELLDLTNRRQGIAIRDQAIGLMRDPTLPPGKGLSEAQKLYRESGIDRVEGRIWELGDLATAIENKREQQKELNDLAATMTSNNVASDLINSEGGGDIAEVAEVIAGLEETGKEGKKRALVLKERYNNKQKGDPTTVPKNLREVQRLLAAHLSSPTDIPAENVVEEGDVQGLDNMAVSQAARDAIRTYLKNPKFQKVGAAIKSLMYANWESFQHQGQSNSRMGGSYDYQTDKDIADEVKANEELLKWVEGQKGDISGEDLLAENTSIVGLIKTGLKPDEYKSFNELNKIMGEGVPEKIMKQVNELRSRGMPYQTIMELDYLRDYYKNKAKAVKLPPEEEIEEPIFGTEIFRPKYFGISDPGGIE